MDAIKPFKKLNAHRATCSYIIVANINFDFIWRRKIGEEMKSFEDRYYLHNPTLLQQCKRDISLFRDSAGFLLLWLTRGRQLRRALRMAEQEGHTLVIEEHLGHDKQ